MDGKKVTILKANLRKAIDKNNFLLKLWHKYYNVKVKIPFMHWLLINQLHFNYLIKVKKYKKLVFDREIVNGIYKVFLEKKTNTVVKIIRRDNLISYQFYLCLKNEENYKQFVEMLEGASKAEFIGSYTTMALKIYKNGSYISPFIEGINLQMLKTDLSISEDINMETNEYIILGRAMDDLYSQLAKYSKKYGYIPGDWMLHNLVYAKDLKKVINVDLEGFYTYRGHQIENDLDRIKSDFDKLKLLLIHEKRTMELG